MPVWQKRKLHKKRMGELNIHTQKNMLKICVKHYDLLPHPEQSRAVHILELKVLPEPVLLCVAEQRRHAHRPGNLAKKKG